VSGEGRVEEDEEADVDEEVGEKVVEKEGLEELVEKKEVVGRRYRSD
jgi:hypothetical protein